MAVTTPTSPNGELPGDRRLHRIKILHTLVWALFAAAIVLAPLFAWLGRLRLAWALIVLVSIEVLVLLLNHWRCPLTDVAARYTEDRRDNFDIYLPEWLARHNKSLFGTLFVVGIMYTSLRQAGLW